MRQLMDAPNIRLNSLTRRPTRARQVLQRRQPRTVCFTASTSAIHSRSSLELDDPNPLLAYEVLQGPLVRWARPGVGVTPPTAVLVHGILGSRRNMQSFARMLLEDLPAWQILLVDLRCHGDTAGLAETPEGPHSVSSAASDILTLLRKLKLFPNQLIGHSFGAKVVLSMVEQFGLGLSLPRPVQVWALDALPGEVRAEGDGRDHPSELIEALRGMPLPISSRSEAAEMLTRAGFSPAISQWAVTNLRPLTSSSSTSLYWTFDLDGIKELYQSYESTNLYPVLEKPPHGLKLDFVKAEGSNFRWGGEDEQYIRSLGHNVHLLRNSGHWVHSDNPKDLIQIMADSFRQHRT